jgi:hypothetical protein
MEWSTVSKALAKSIEIASTTLLRIKDNGDIIEDL